MLPWFCSSHVFSRGAGSVPLTALSAATSQTKPLCRAWPLLPHLMPWVLTANVNHATSLKLSTQTNRSLTSYSALMKMELLMLEVMIHTLFALLFFLNALSTAKL